MNNMSLSDKYILSLFDYSKVWGGQYEQSGYPVIYYDIKHKNGLDILNNLCTYVDLPIFGVIAMPPCTDFAGSGARWWKEKDKPGSANCECCQTTTEHHMVLTLATLHLIDWVKPEGFWVLEQPVGRIERLIPELRPHRKMTFNPCDYGDPYTKRTVLYGDFNTSLPKKPVEPKEGSRMHKLWSRSEKARGQRSLTPNGFASAFYQANNIEQLKLEAA